MEFQAISQEPSPPLSRFVESLWFARGHIPYQRELIAPTGSTVLAVNFGSPIRQGPQGSGALTAMTRGFLIGPHDRPIVNEPTAETHCAGVVLRPAACQVVLGLAPAPLRGTVTELDRQWRPAAEVRARLINRTDDPEALLRDFAQLLSQRLGTERPDLQRCERAVALIEVDPARPIADLAAEVGWSHAHLVRRFTTTVGLGPRRLAAILRTRRLLDALDIYADVPWSEVAVRHGWYDQSHLIRDFKRHTGVTPSAYVRAQRRHFEPADAAPGFVPERDDDQILPRRGGRPTVR